MIGRGSLLRRIAVGVLIAILVVGGIMVGYRRLTSQRTRVQYVTRPVDYTDITATVNETGTVNPVNEILVGTQVSGTIAVLNVDYNSRVTQGQVLATLDPTSFQAAVAQNTATLAAAQATASADAATIQQNLAAAQAAEATLAQQQASLRSAQANVAKAAETLKLAKVTVQRDADLLRQGYIPQSQMDTDQTAESTDTADLAAAQAAVQVAQAQVRAATSQLQSARDQVATTQSQLVAAQHQAAATAAQLREAQYNLSQTVIRSPVDGIVMARNVSIGQTVAASFSTPTLFTLATNLTDMQVDTSVDEADVGNVKAGDSAQITVTAFPNVTFNGTVQQVRVNPTVTNNVVTYDAVVAVHDTSGRLLPGMTAQVTIDTGTRSHVLAVPTAAVLYRPLARGGGGGEQPGGGLVLAQTGTSQQQQSGPPVAGAPGSTVTVWVLRSGRPAPVRIVIGMSDGQNIEVSSGRLQQGDPVIVAERRGGARGAGEGQSQGSQGGQGGQGGGGQGGRSQGGGQ
ncbi:MAG TPA: efflux RND transporter periplasmic adaptor subunit [bacterium]|nr:efflux RND transporter periplasmic adaptor subunit [bacterium]